MKRQVISTTFGITIILIATFFLHGCDNKRKSNVDIATIVPLTGAAAELGKYNLNSAEMFVDQFNASGANKLRLIAEDSKSTAKDGLQGLQAAFAKAQPVAVMVHQGAVSVALAPELAKRQAIMFYIGATPEPKASNPLAFRMYPDPGHVASKTVDQILLPQKLRRLAILWANDEFGLAVAKAFRQRAAETGIEIVLDEGYLATITDFRTTLAKASEAHPDALYLVGVGAPLGRMIAQSREMGFKGTIVSGPEIQFGDVMKVAGPAAEGAIFLDLAYDPESSEEPAASFVKAYHTRYGQTPNSASAFVYDAWAIFTAALSQATSQSSSDVAAAILRLKTYKGVCGEITISQERDFVFPLKSKVIRNGKVQWYE